MKTTTKDFIYFKDRCLYWQDYLNLKQLRLYFSHKDCGEAYATTNPDYEGCIATITLSDDWGNEKVTARQLNHSAKHEMIHLLIQPLTNLANERFVTKDHIYEEDEALTRLLERFIK